MPKLQHMTKFWLYLDQVIPFVSCFISHTLEKNLVENKGCPLTVSVTAALPPLPPIPRYPI